jgi:hypothetical protein
MDWLNEGSVPAFGEAHTPKTPKFTGSHAVDIGFNAAVSSTPGLAF